MLSTTINHTTMKRYFRVDSSITLNDKQPDPLLDTRILESQCIKDILSEIKRWDSTPNHREPFTMKMVLNMCKKFKNKYPESLDSVLCDWIVLDIFYCFLLAESTQNAWEKMQILACADGVPLSFIYPDLTFLGADRSTISSHSRRNFTTPASNSSN